MTETYYLLKTSNDAFYVLAKLAKRPGETNWSGFEFLGEPDYATRIPSQEMAQTVAEKYGFIVYKVTVTTEMEKL